MKVAIEKLKGDYITLRISNEAGQIALVVHVQNLGSAELHENSNSYQLELKPSAAWGNIISSQADGVKE